MGTILYGDNLPVLRSMPSNSIPLIYIDPPFNTGRRQQRTTLKTVQDEVNGDRIGFGGRHYRTSVQATVAYDDRFEDYLAFLEPRLSEARRILTPSGSLFFHIDYREVHYCKVLLDSIFGRESFINEIIWAYDFGGRAKRRWPAKHDNILWYARDPSNYVFNYEAIERIPYMAPGLVGPDKAARGKTPTDVWWQTIVSPTSHEKTGYPTQKPVALAQRIVTVHSLAGDTVLDFFAGSGTVGEAAARNGRDFILVDNNPRAISVMSRRLQAYRPDIIDLVSETSTHWVFAVDVSTDESIPMG